MERGPGSANGTFARRWDLDKAALQSVEFDVVSTLDPAEMGMIDAACVGYRASERPYRSMAEHEWGAQAFAIRWPACMLSPRSVSASSMALPFSTLETAVSIISSAKCVVAWFSLSMLSRMA